MDGKLVCHTGTYKSLSGFYITKICVLLAIEITEPVSMKSKCVRVNSRDEG